MEIQLPNWLLDISKNNDTSVFEFNLPLILKDSLFYPASGLDAMPIKHLTGVFYSFVYADYGISEEALNKALHLNGFKGYDIIVNRSLDISKELHSELATPFDRNKVKSGIVETVNPYARWLVMKSQQTEKAFSLLYLGLDGVDCYRHLYGSRKIPARGVAIIRPGTGWGNNWTNFKDPQSPLAEVVTRSVLQCPEFLICGGTEDNALSRSYWPEIYNDHVFSCRTFKKDGFNVYQLTAK